MTKLVAGVLAIAVSLTAAAAVAQTPENMQMAAPAAADKSVRDGVLAAAKAAPKSAPKASESSKNSMMAASGGADAPAAAAQSGTPAVRGTAPKH
jgi:hypothetical protein